MGLYIETGPRFQQYIGVFGADHARLQMNMHNRLRKVDKTTGALLALHHTLKSTLEDTGIQKSPAVGFRARLYVERPVANIPVRLNMTFLFTLSQENNNVEYYRLC